MKTIATILLSASLVGCSSAPKWLENRLACTADRQDAFVVSMWGWLGIASKVAPADASVICKTP